MKRITLGILLFIFWSLNTFAFVNGGGKEGEKEKKEEVDSIPSLTVENLREELQSQGVQHVEIVLRQAINETGWLKCENCSLDRNNIFGFYYKKKYLEFDDWTQCVAYYKRWQEKWYKGGDYYNFLEEIGFATNPKYIEYLKSIDLDN